MSIDKELIKKKLSFLDKHLSAIEDMDFSEDEFMSDPDIHDLIVFRLQQSVETCIDIAAHIVTQIGSARKETAKDTLLALGNEGVIDKNLSEKMGVSADFRNRVVHGYNDFDYEKMYDDYEDNVGDLREFGRQILKFIES